MSAEELEHLRASLGKLRKWERELLLKRFLEGYYVAMVKILQAPDDAIE